MRSLPKMLSSQEKKEKNKFFRDLDHLDTVSGNDDDTDVLSSSETPSKKPRRPPNLKVTQSLPAIDTVDMEGNRRKRKPSQEILKSSDRHPSLKRAATVPEQSSTLKIPPVLERNVTDLSNLEARLKGEGKPKLKPLPKNRRVAKVDRDNQIFKGVVICR